jgi:hypothetical protein
MCLPPLDDAPWPEPADDALDPFDDELLEPDDELLEPDDEALVAEDEALVPEGLDAADPEPAPLVPPLDPHAARPRASTAADATVSSRFVPI